MLEKRISRDVSGRELVMFTCRTNEETGNKDVVFKGRNNLYSVTYTQIVEALVRRNALEEFMSQLIVAAKQQGYCVTSL